MKPLHIVLILAAAIGVGVAISFMGNTTRYVGFTEAKMVNTESPGKEFHIVCNLDRSKPQVDDPATRPNYFEFYATDTIGTSAKVVYYKPKPTDFGQGEGRLVLIGSYKKDYFECKEILSKCPSKYEDSPIKK